MRMHQKKCVAPQPLMQNCANKPRLAARIQACSDLAAREAGDGKVLLHGKDHHMLGQAAIGEGKEALAIGAKYRLTSTLNEGSPS